jgi:alpha-ketoglutarate-dependent taurine dioxygenase
MVISTSATVEVQEVRINEQQLQGDGHYFPLVLSLITDAHSLPEVVKYIKENKSDIESKLLQTGVVLFRGFPLSTPQDFLDFVNAFEYEFGTYVGGGGPRNIVLGPVHTSTETPPDVKIQFHHELAYLLVNPRALFFFCEVPPAADGETPILNSNRVYTKLQQQNPQFIENLVQKKSEIYSSHF